MHALQYSEVQRCDGSGAEEKNHDMQKNVMTRRSMKRHGKTSHEIAMQCSEVTAESDMPLQTLRSLRKIRCDETRDEKSQHGMTQDDGFTLMPA